MMTEKRDPECVETSEALTDSAVDTPTAPGNVMESQKYSVSRSVPVAGMSREGGLNGETVRLISGDGKFLDVPLHIAKECELLDRMLSGTFVESQRRELTLPNIRHRTLSKVVEYLRRRCQWREGGGVPLEFEVDDDIAVDLLIAADYLGMK